MPEISLAQWHVRYSDALGELVFPWDSLFLLSRCSQVSCGALSFQKFSTSTLDWASRWPQVQEGTFLLLLPGHYLVDVGSSRHLRVNPFGIVPGEGCHTNADDINASHHGLLPVHYQSLVTGGQSTGLTAITAASGDVRCSSHLQSISCWELIFIPGRQVS